MLVVKGAMHLEQQAYNHTLSYINFFLLNQLSIDLNKLDYSHEATPAWEGMAYPNTDLIKSLVLVK